MNRFIWYMKQLLPLTYWSNCRYEYCGVSMRVLFVWKMWLGRCYRVRAWEVAKEIDPFETGLA